MKQIELVAKSGISEIYINEKFDNIHKYINPDNTIIISDENVFRLYKNVFPKCKTITIQSGEKNKSLGTVEYIYEKFLEFETGRSSFILGIGGGIVCDIAGYAASTYNRGMKFGFVPTTLLAQVDASIGGKNGLNFKSYKNLIGLIRQPEFILIDINFLNTLSQREILTGFAEIIKSAIIASEELFQILESSDINPDNLLPKQLIDIVTQSILIKKEIVEKDENERGIRKLLNFGHTIGHALEKITGSLTHGEAVSIGISAALDISERLSFINIDLCNRIKKLLIKFSLPVYYNYEHSEIIEGIKKDKKRIEEDIEFILLEGISMPIVHNISIIDIHEVLKHIKTK